jgi:hypothetical protein
MNTKYEYHHTTRDHLPCEDCGAVWVNLPTLGKGAKEMQHEPDCAYIAWVFSGCSEEGE